MGALFTILVLLIIILLIAAVISLIVEKDAGFFICLLFAALISLGLYAGLKEKEREAIVAGAAHYQTVIGKDGSVTNKFVWGLKKEDMLLTKGAVSQ